MGYKKKMSFTMDHNELSFLQKHRQWVPVIFYVSTPIVILFIRTAFFSCQRRQPSESHLNNYAWQAKIAGTFVGKRAWSHVHESLHQFRYSGEDNILSSAVPYSAKMKLRLMWGTLCWGTCPMSHLLTVILRNSKVLRYSFGALAN
jgi:hypothetical protein